MKRILIAVLLSLLGTTAYAQQWDQVNGSMQVKSGPSAPLVIVDQTATTQKIQSWRSNGTEVCFSSATAFTCAATVSFSSGVFLAGDGTAAAPSYSFTSEAGSGWYRAGAGDVRLSILGTDAARALAGSWTLPAGSTLTWGSAGVTGGDLSMGREGADHLFQRRTTNAQRASWANTYTSTISYESFSVDWQTLANTAIVGTRTAATGTIRPVRLVSQTTNGGDSYTQFQLNRNGTPFVLQTIATAAGTIDSLSSTGNWIEFGGGTSTATSGTNARFALLPTYNQSSGTAANTDLLINRTQTAVGSGAQLLIDAQVGSATRWNVTNLGYETTTQAATASPVQSLTSLSTGDDPIETVTQYRTTTTNNTPTAIATVTIPTDFTVGISCDIIARRTGGAAGAANDGAYYTFKIVMKNTTGTAAEIAAETVAVVGESVAAWTVTAAAAGATEVISVTGETNYNVTWHATCRTWQVNA